MELIDSINNLKVDDDNKYYLDDTINDYRDYYLKIQSLSLKMQKCYLSTLRDRELEKSSQLEKVDPFILSLYGNMHRKNSLQEVIKLYSEKENLEKKDLLKLHKLIMSGTDNEEKSDKFRDSNDYFVGSFNDDGTKRIDYEVLDCNQIDSAIDELLLLLKEKNTDNPFIIPFIFHASIAIMQPFTDGNTRLSRLIQHGKIWRLTNDIYGTTFESPILYLSENYFVTNYREQITKLANNLTNEGWNKWIMFNLNMVNEQLFFQNNNLDLIRERNL